MLVFLPLVLDSLDLLDQALIFMQVCIGRGIRKPLEVRCDFRVIDAGKVIKNELLQVFIASTCQWVTIDLLFLLLLNLTIGTVDWHVLDPTEHDESFFEVCLDLRKRLWITLRNEL